MANLPGVRIGPLDPDRAEAFGSVAAGAQSARQLIRHHVAMHPPALIAALSRRVNEARSGAIDREEAEEAIRAHYADLPGEDLPEDAKITGVNVHGEDDAPELMVLGFTYALPSGRTGKGFVPYDADTLPNSMEDGDDAVRIAEAKKAGLPWEPRSRRLREGDEFARRVSGRRPRGDDGDGDEKAALRARVEELEGRLADVEASPPEPPTPEGGATGDAATPPVSDSGVTSSPQNPEGGSGDLPPAEGAGEDEPPFEGYDDVNAPDLRRRIAETDDSAEVERIVAYERAHQGRSTVISAGEQKLDRSGGS